MRRAGGRVPAPAAFRGGGGGGDSPSFADRALAALPYLLPALDALRYGRFIFMQAPFVARALAPLAPLNALYRSFPFSGFIFFLAVYGGIANNQSLSRFTRYNAMQAVLLDILLM